MEKIIDEARQGEVLFFESKTNNSKKLFIESYGCAMNFSDSEIVASILSKIGFDTTTVVDEADLILINTCSIRDKAEQTIRRRLEQYQILKRSNPKLKIGLLGCMAERLKEQLLEEEKIVDLVVGPDAYKDLPNLLLEVEEHQSAINVTLSKDETYGDISPIRLMSNGITALVSITRGCDNMCTFCVVPFTRGRERSRDPQSILTEIQDLYQKGFKEVTLLGQNVDSYLWYGGGLKKDFSKISPDEKTNSTGFDKLLETVARTFPKMRIRFSTSNPQDMHESVLHTIAKYPNICKHIHLPVQSGSNRILKEMNRQHTREEYIVLVDKIRKIVPDSVITQDMISGFPTETEKDHQDTLDLMNYVKYQFGYMYAYSERPGTMAARKMKDDIPEVIKLRRLQEIVDLQQKHSKYRNEEFIGQTVEVLVEKTSKRSMEEFSGRNSQNITVVFPKENYKIGNFVNVKIEDCTSGTLRGTAVGLSEMNYTTK